MNDEPNAVRSAIRALYEVFARYKLDGPVLGCPHCTSSRDDEALRSQKLERLPASCLERFAVKAMTTLGTERDFKHFLPRLFELFADRAVDDLDYEILFGKLEYAKWTRWPEAEQAAVRSFLMAMWEAVLSDPLPEVPPWVEWPQRTADEALCCIGQAEDTLMPYLTAWERRTDLMAARHLAAFIDNNVENLRKRRGLQSAFWSGREAPMQQVIGWLISEQRIDWLQAAFFHIDANQAGTPAEVELSVAVGQLEMLRVAM